MATDPARIVVAREALARLDRLLGFWLPAPARDAARRELGLSDERLSTIAGRYGYSRERIRQIGRQGAAWVRWRLRGWRPVGVLIPPPITRPLSGQNDPLTWRP